ncbi:helix-turn-helix domain-containing protein [Streptacidiphilus sp. BW17]|uniref:helix-turn-helix domain-containing protein n=1 Tax=Streptacidiphilus sp. BW17 TaxID=3156274 RepID=UPI003518A09B
MHQHRSGAESGLVRQQAAAELRGSVLGYRGFRLGPRGVRRRLMVPDGVVKVMWGFGGPLRVVDALDSGRAVTVDSLASGVRTSAVVGEHRGRLEGITVLLTPLAAYRVFGVPMDEWAELSLAPDDLVEGGTGSLVERLAEAPDWAGRFALLDRLLSERLDRGPAVSDEVAWCCAELRRTAGRVRVEELAVATGWSRRHLERRFRQQVGPSPKSYAQVLRLQHTLRRQEAGLPWSRVAAEAGFHDESHFDRTFKRMVGCTPGQFRADRVAGSRTDPRDFLPGQVTSVLMDDAGPGVPRPHGRAAAG